MPIPFSTWIDGVLGNANTIANRQLLSRVWLNGEKNITSITSFDEAYEQLVGDLDALGYLETYSKHSSLNLPQQQAVREYIESIRDFDNSPFLREGTLNIEAMLNSETWAGIERKAQNLVSLLKKK